MAIRTSLCRELGIDYPIFSVGFGYSAGPELASAEAALAVTGQLVQTPR